MSGRNLVGRIGTRIVVGLAVAITLALLRSTGALGATTAGWTVLTKPADESVASSAVLQADDDLTFTATTGVPYEVELALVYGSPVGGATPDINALVYEDVTIRGQCGFEHMNNADTVGATVVADNSAATAIALGTNGSRDRLARVRCIHMGAGGAFGLWWSQRTSNAGASIIRAGSQLRYRAATDAYLSPLTTVAWADVTGKPDFAALYCDADGTEGDSDCGGGGADLSDYYTAEEVDGIAELASDTCGGPSLPACEVELSASDRERLDLSWWGVWAAVGMLFVVVLAGAWFRAFRVTHGG